MNRPSCYGTTAKRSPYDRNHQCMNCLYLLDCIEKEKMLEQTKTNPTCYGTQPKTETALWKERNCAYCVNLESCYRVTFSIGTGDDLKRAENFEKLKSEYPDKFNFDPTAGDKIGLVVGTKLDNDKLRWSLLPSGTIAQVIAVLEYGAKKYAVNNWIEVPDARTRYYDAAMRHLDAWRGSEVNDIESGLPHLAHAACCVLFLLWFDGKSVS